MAIKWLIPRESLLCWESGHRRDGHDPGLIYTWGFWMLDAVSPLSYKVVWACYTPVEAEPWRMGHLHSAVRTHSAKSLLWESKSNNVYLLDWTFWLDWLFIGMCPYKSLKHWTLKVWESFLMGGLVFQRLRLRRGWINGHFRHPSYGHHAEAALSSHWQKFQNSIFDRK